MHVRCKTLYDAYQLGSSNELPAWLIKETNDLKLNHYNLETQQLCTTSAGCIIAYTNMLLGDWVLWDGVVIVPVKDQQFETQYERC